MSYQTADAKRQFDAWSGSYDRNPLQRWFFEPAHRLLLEALTPEDRRILDVGCGTSRFAAQVGRRFPGTRVVGLDLSAKMLSQGRDQCRRPGGPGDLVQADSERLPFADAVFDAVTCTHSFHHYPHQERVVAEMHRVLRPRGRLLIIDGDRDRWWGRLVYDVAVVWWEGDVHHRSGRSFRRLFRRVGFDEVCQRRHGGPLPFLLTEGQAVKPAARVRRSAA
jgi:ubiquinone/menaquinone biosynthesis C-methylase UbiE